MSMEQTLTMIAAASKNNVIGVKGKLPWYIPEDLKRFKKLTMGHPVVMGRKTIESILKTLGGPLPGRKNIVLSKTMEKQNGIYIARDIDQAFMLTKGEDTYIAGGQGVFEDFYPYINRMELTRIHENFEGDRFLPFMNKNDWNLINEENEETEEGLKYSFLTYEIDEVSPY